MVRWIGIINDILMFLLIGGQSAEVLAPDRRSRDTKKELVSCFLGYVYVSSLVTSLEAKRLVFSLIQLLVNDESAAAC